MPDQSDKKCERNWLCNKLDIDDPLVREIYKNIIADPNLQKKIAQQPELATIIIEKIFTYKRKRIILQKEHLKGLDKDSEGEHGRFYVEKVFSSLKKLLIKIGLKN